MTGVYPQRLRTTNEDVPAYILRRLHRERQDRAGEKRRRTANDQKEDRAADAIAYYDREATAFRCKWFGGLSR